MAYPAKTLLPFVLILVVAAALLPAETSAPTSDMREGIELFRNGSFEKAIPFFTNVLLDPTAETQQPEAYLLLAKSYVALGKLKDAERNLEFYLAQYPSSAGYPEALYQKGRLLFLQEDFESVIQLFQSFLETYPESSFVPNAWFWVGESLYSLGKLDEAKVVYQKITRDYPTSFKVEAAQYRISLIELRQKEVELSRLLKWSHEEFMKSIEEYQRRERMYQQAIEAYQKKLASSLSETPTVSSPTASTPAQETATAEAAAAAAAQKEQQAALARMQRLLEIKREALALKEQYLSWLEASREKAK